MLTDKSNVKLDIIDLFGSLKKSLMNEALIYGRYKYSFSPAEAGLASGIYFARITSDSGMMLKRFVVVK